MSLGSHRRSIDGTPLRRLLIVEYLCAGFVDLAEASPSMLAEGRAMLLAILRDAAAIEGLQIITIWHDRLGGFPFTDVDVLRVSSTDHAIETWRDALSTADAVYVIAPESDGIL